MRLIRHFAGHNNSAGKGRETDRKDYSMMPPKFRVGGISGFLRMKELCATKPTGKEDKITGEHLLYFITKLDRDYINEMVSSRSSALFNELSNLNIVDKIKVIIDKILNSKSKCINILSAQEFALTSLLGLIQKPHVRKEFSQHIIDEEARKLFDSLFAEVQDLSGQDLDEYEEYEDAEAAETAEADREAEQEIQTQQDIEQEVSALTQEEQVFIAETQETEEIEGEVIEGKAEEKVERETERETEDITAQEKSPITEAEPQPAEREPKPQIKIPMPISSTEQTRGKNIKEIDIRKVKEKIREAKDVYAQLESIMKDISEIKKEIEGIKEDIEIIEEKINEQQPSSTGKAAGIDRIIAEQNKILQELNKFRTEITQRINRIEKEIELLKRKHSSVTTATLPQDKYDPEQTIESKVDRARSRASEMAKRMEQIKKSIEGKESEGIESTSETTSDTIAPAPPKRPRTKPSPSREEPLPEPDRKRRRKPRVKPIEPEEPEEIPKRRRKKKSSEIKEHIQKQVKKDDDLGFDPSSLFSI